ncbi:MAG: nitroreductase family protein, partial [Clostridia bacterium]|nr:nitroreductase family protein [Clostridia bacterium]
MNQTIKTLTERRSVRKFTDKPISKEDIELILKAGVYAPTG